MKDQFDRQWITENALQEIAKYERGVLTIRGLHYRLVARGMTNTMRHYKRVVSAMIKARKEGVVSFDTFSDRDRAMAGNTYWRETDLEQSIEIAKEEIGNWMKYYSKNRWENQKFYPEVFIEKKALEGVFEKPCFQNRVALGACKGYPSLTFLYEASLRFRKAIYEGKKPIILYFGDYDPSGEDIPRSIGENLKELGAPVEVRRILLLHDQVVRWGLPPAPAKSTDSRTANWDGLGQVELDAVEPKKLRQLCSDAINDIFDFELHDQLMDQQKDERKKYQEELKEYVTSLGE